MHYDVFMTRSALGLKVLRLCDKDAYNSIHHIHHIFWYESSWNFFKFSRSSKHMKTSYKTYSILPVIRTQLIRNFGLIEVSLLSPWICLLNSSKKSLSYSNFSYSRGFSLNSYSFKAIIFSYSYSWLFGVNFYPFWNCE